MRLAPGVTRGALVAELAAVVGAPHEARFIVDEALGLGLVLGHPDAPTGALDDDVVAAARAMAGRRVAGEPLQYVFGHWPFRSLDLLVDPRVLIPRPETEQVVQVAHTEARRLRAARRSAGSGRRRRRHRERRYRTVARGRARDPPWCARSGPSMRAPTRWTWLRPIWRACGRRTTARCSAVELVAGSWLEPLPAPLRGEVSLVVSNPPYVSEAEWADLDAEVRAEPRDALVAGPGSDGTPGLAGVEAVLAQSKAWLRRPGAVVVELAPHQAEPRRRTGRAGSGTPVSRSSPTWRAGRGCWWRESDSGTRSHAYWHPRVHRPGAAAWW